MTDKQLVYYIKGKLEGIEGKLDDVVLSVNANTKKGNEHDKIIARAVGYIAGIAVIIGIVVNVSIGWIRDRFLT